MEIVYLSNSLFKIKSKKAVFIVGLPKDPLPKEKVDFVCFSQKTNLKTLSLKPVSRKEVLEIDDPGEYEVSGVSIFGVDLSAGEEENIGYIFEAEGTRLVHLGNLARDLTEKEIEEINGVDVLFAPVGGGELIDSEKTLKLVAKIEPDNFIPMQYKSQNSNLELEDSLEDFLKAAGIENLEKLAKLNVTSSENQEPATKIVVLKEKSN